MTLQQRGKKYEVLSGLWSVIVMMALFSPKGSIEVDSSFFFPGADKLAHFLLFAIWIFLIARAMKGRKTMISTRILFCLFIAVGLLTEIIQIPIEGRAFDWLDWIADICGLVVGLLFYRRIS